MESGKVAFRKPDFDNDAASQNTDVAPHEAVHSDEVAVPGSVQKPGEADESYSPTAIRHHAEAKNGRGDIAPDEGTSPTTTRFPAGVNSPADDAEFTPAAKPRVHLHRVSVSTTDRHMNPGRRPTKVQFAEGFGERDEKSNKDEDTDKVWAARTDRARRLSSVVAVPGVMTEMLPFPTRARNMTVKVAKGIWTMFSTFPYWDMAFWSSAAYSVGSVLFVIVGAFEWVPIAFPYTEFPGETDYAEGIIFFIGALLYEFGAVMAYLEAINDGSFAGTGMKRFLEGHDEDKKSLLDAKLHNFFGHIVPHHHHHSDEEEENDLKKQASVDPEAGWRTIHRAERPGSIYPEGFAPAPRRVAVDHGEAEKEGNHEYLTWQWYAPWKSWKNYHIKQPGYVACTIQLFGATLYGIDGVVALPKVTSGFTHNWQTLAASWIPAVVGSVCFLTASILFTLITQEDMKLWKPAPWKISWWIGIWAGVGSMGFLLNGIFGTASLYCASWTGYQSSLSTLWGSTAYLISALLQWYEAVNQGPVLAFPNNRIPTLLR